MYITLKKDKDWASIEGRLCLVTDFFPRGRVENGRVIAMSQTMPYASVRLKCENLPDDITGFIGHKTDFAMLWAAFNERTQVPGTRVEVRSTKELNPNGLGKNEEVWLVWTRKNYVAVASLFGCFLPRLIVMVCRKGAFELALDRERRLRPDLQGEARLMAIAPLVTWTPKIMG
jgi:hypothetical protein